LILFLKHPKNSTRKFINLRNIFSKVAGYKINVQKPPAFLYKTMKVLRKKSGKIIPFTIASKNNIK
jgi:hypothetical protein